jgi:hypothetical protein
MPPAVAERRTAAAEARMSARSHGRQRATGEWGGVFESEIRLKGTVEGERSEGVIGGFQRAQGMRERPVPLLDLDD